MDFQRNATAGAPKGNGGYKGDEDFDPPSPAPTGNITSQHPPAAAQTQSREQTFVPAAAAATPACNEDVSHSLSSISAPFQYSLNPFVEICHYSPASQGLTRSGGTT